MGDKKKRIRVIDLIHKYAMVNEDFLLYTNGLLYGNEMLENYNEIFDGDGEYLKMVEEYLQKFSDVDELCCELYDNVTLAIENEIKEMMD